MCVIYIYIYIIIHGVKEILVSKRHICMYLYFAARLNIIFAQCRRHQFLSLLVEHRAAVKRLHHFSVFVQPLYFTPGLSTIIGFLFYSPPPCLFMDIILSSLLADSSPLSISHSIPAFGFCRVWGLSTAFFLCLIRC